MKKTSEFIVVIIIGIIMLGCSSKGNMTEELKGYIDNNREELFDIATISYDLLSEENYGIFVDEDNELKLYTSKNGEYIDASEIDGTDYEHLEVIRNFINDSCISSIHLFPADRVISFDNNRSDENAVKDDSYICMYIDNSDFNRYKSHTIYSMYFVESDVISAFRNPMEAYNEGGFGKTESKDSIRWVSDHRFDIIGIIKGEPPVRYEAEVIKACDGILLCREYTKYPLWLVFLAG